MPGHVSIRDADVAELYQSVAEAIAQARVADAATAIRKIPGRVASGGAGRKAIPLDSQLAVFRRDGFNCMYCDRRVVLPAMPRLLSDYFAPIDANLFPYHLHGKMTSCHLAFWRDLASCDHLVPAARGGDCSLENLITCCYMCNSVKQNWTLDELGWQRLGTAPRPWDGLSNAYPSIVAIVWRESVPPEYHRRWLKALAKTNRLSEPN